MTTLGAGYPPHPLSNPLYPLPYGRPEFAFLDRRNGFGGKEISFNARKYNLIVHIIMSVQHPVVPYHLAPHLILTPNP